MPRLVRSFMFIAVALSLLLTACGTAATEAPTAAMPGATSAPAATQAPAQPTALPAGSVQITAGGATFPYPLYTQWTYAFQLVDPSTVINYQGIGSGGGKALAAENLVEGKFDGAGAGARRADDGDDGMLN